MQQLSFNQMLSPEATVAAGASKKHSFSWEPFAHASVTTSEYLPRLHAKSLVLYPPSQRVESHNLQDEGKGPALSNTQPEISPAYAA